MISLQGLNVLQNSLEVTLWIYLDTLTMRISNVLSCLENCNKFPDSDYQENWASFIDAFSLLKNRLDTSPVVDVYDVADDNSISHIGLHLCGCKLSECELYGVNQATAHAMINAVHTITTFAQEIIDTSIKFIVSQSRTRSDTLCEATRLGLTRDPVAILLQKLEKLMRVQTYLGLKGQIQISNESSNSINESIKARLTVSQNPPQITLDGETHEVSPEGARLVQVAIDFQGEYFTPGEHEFTKAHRIKEKLPKPIREFLESQVGKGTRIPLDKLQELGCIKQK